MDGHPYGTIEGMADDLAQPTEPRPIWWERAIPNADRAAFPLAAGLAVLYAASSIGAWATGWTWLDISREVIWTVIIVAVIGTGLAAIRATRKLRDFYRETLQDFYTQARTTADTLATLAGEAEAHGRPNDAARLQQAIHDLYGWKTDQPVR